MREFHKLQPGQIALGEALRWDVFDRSGTLLLRKGYVVALDDQVEQLVERGMYVDSIEYQASLAGTEPPYDPFYIMSSVQANLALLLDEMPRDGSLEGLLGVQAERIAWLAERSPDTALAAMQLSEQRNYPAAHAFFTATLADIMAQHAGWDEDRRFSLLCAALSMNVAMHELQQHLRNHRGGLSPEQKSLVDDHPAAGVRMLMECGVDDREWLRAVLEHHERTDGTGYPRKVSALSELSLLIQSCDMYTAMVSPRGYRPQLNGSEAVRQVYVASGGGKSNPFGALLVKEIGLYPPGTLVKLANGELGVVFQRGEGAKTPIVMTLINAKGLRCADPIRRDTSQAGCEVVGVIPPEKSMVSVQLEKIWRHRH